jgi:hypothetical protein
VETPADPSRCLQWQWYEGRWESGGSPFEKADHNGEGQALDSKVIVIIDVEI